MEWFLNIINFIIHNWSVDSLVYLTMLLIGILTWYIGFSNESSKSGKILISAGLFLFVTLFGILFVFTLLKKI